MTGLALVYLYFLIPLMVLTITPGARGAAPAVARGGRTTSAPPAGSTGGTSAARCSRPPVLGATMLLFASAFAAYATAAALVGSSVPLVTLQIADALSSNVVVGSENLGKALALGMVVLDRPRHGLLRLGPAAHPAVAGMTALTDRASPVPAESRARDAGAAGPRGGRAPGGSPSWSCSGSTSSSRSPPRCCSPCATAARAASPPSLHRDPRRRRASPTAFTRSLVLAAAHRGPRAGCCMVPTVVLVELRLPRLRTTVELLTLLPLVVPPIALVVGVRSVLSWAPDYFLNTPLAAGVLRPPGAGAALDPGAASTSSWRCRSSTARWTPGCAAPTCAP